MAKAKKRRETAAEYVARTRGSIAEAIQPTVCFSSKKRKRKKIPRLTLADDMQMPRSYRRKRIGYGMD